MNLENNIHFNQKKVNLSSSFEGNINNEIIRKKTKEKYSL